MLSSQLAFFLCILTLLFADLLCLPWTATAQSNQPQLISLPIQEFVPNAFIVYGRAPTQEDAGITKDVRYRQTTETLPNLKTFFEFGGTLELLTTTLFFSKHDIVISEIMWGLDTGSSIDAHDPYTQWIELYNPHVGAHITAHLFLLFTPFENYPGQGYRRAAKWCASARARRCQQLTLRQMELAWGEVAGVHSAASFQRIATSFIQKVALDDRRCHSVRIRRVGKPPWHTAAEIHYLVSLTTEVE